MELHLGKVIRGRTVKKLIRGKQNKKTVIFAEPGGYMQATASSTLRQGGTLDRMRKQNLQVRDIIIQRDCRTRLVNQIDSRKGF